MPQAEPHMVEMRVRKLVITAPGPALYFLCTTTPSTDSTRFLTSELESVEALCRANPAAPPRGPRKQTMQSIAGTIRTAKRCTWARAVLAGLLSHRTPMLLLPVAAFRRRVAAKSKKATGSAGT